jgi:hypothetical protein
MLKKIFALLVEIPSSLIALGRKLIAKDKKQIFVFHPAVASPQTSDGQLVSDADTVNYFLESTDLVALTKLAKKQKA